MSNRMRWKLGVQPPCRDIFDILNVATARKQGRIEVTGQLDGRLNYALTAKGEQEREKGQTVSELCRACNGLGETRTTRHVQTCGCGSFHCSACLGTYETVVQQCWQCHGTGRITAKGEQEREKGQAE